MQDKLRLVGTMLLLAAWMAVRAQTIMKCNYWFDNDIGTLRSMSGLSLTESSEATLSLDLSGLSPGFHTVNLRFGSSAGKRSAVSTAHFYKLPMQTGVASGLEYWFDNDRSQVFRKALQPGAEGRDYMMMPEVSALGNGMHTISVRVASADGGMGSVSTAHFYKLSTQLGAASELEYWFDNDRSQVFRKALQPGAEGRDYMMMPEVSALGNGMHTISVRVASADGGMGSVSTAYFLKTLSAGTVTASLDYWFNEDYAGRKTLRVPDGGNFVTMVPNTKGLPYGLNIIHIRPRYANGGEGAVATHYFAKLNPKYMPSEGTGDKICKFRYWFNDNEDKAVEREIEQTTVPFEYVATIPALGLPLGKNTFHYSFVSTNGLSSHDQAVFTNTVDMNGVLNVVRLDPDPNSLISNQLTKGAILAFYYQVQTADKKPVQNVTLKARFGNKELSSSLSDELGVVVLKIDTEDSDIKGDGSKWKIGESADFKFVSLMRENVNVPVLHNDFSERPYTLAHNLVPKSFELALKSGGDLSFGKWLGLGLESNGGMKIKYNPDGTIKEFEANSGGKASPPKMRFPQFLMDVSIYGQLMESASGVPSTYNALAAIDRLTRGTLLGVAGYAYAHAVNHYLQKRGMDEVAFSEEQHGTQFGVRGKFDLHYNGKINPFKLGNWVRSIDFRGLNVAGTLGIDVQLPELSYKGSNRKELKPYRQPYGLFKFSAQDLSYSNDGIMVRGLRCLYDGYPNLWEKRLFISNPRLKADFSVKHEYTQSPYLTSPIEQRTSYSFGIKYPFHPAWNFGGYAMEMDITPKLIWKNSISSRGTMLDLMHRLGDEALRRRTLPSVNDMGGWDFWGMLSGPFADNEARMQKLWKSVQDKSKREFLQSIDDLKNGYQTTSTVDVVLGAKLKMPLIEWFTLKQEAELTVSYDVGPSYYHAKANRLVRPIRFERMDALLDVNTYDDFYVGMRDIVNYCTSSWDVVKADVMPYLEDQWDRGVTKIKDGWNHLFSYNRTLDDQMKRFAPHRLPASFEDKSTLEIAYKDDGSVFTKETDISLVSRFTAGQVIGNTAQGDSLLLIGDLFKLSAKENGNILTTSKAPFKIRAKKGLDDLRYFGLSKDTPLALYHIPEGSDTWMLVGDLNQEAMESRLGYYAIGCKFTHDTTPPVIIVSSNLDKAYIDVTITDNFAVRNEAVGASIDGVDVKPFILTNHMSRIELTEEQLLKDTLSLYVYASDVSGNTSSKLLELVKSRPTDIQIVSQENDICVCYVRSENLVQINAGSNRLGSLVQVYSLSGIQCKTMIVDKETCNLLVRDLQPGVYVVRCGQASCRFVKE